MPDSSRDATVESFKRDDGRFIRTSLRLREGTNSFDLTDPSGKLIARINPVFYKDKYESHWSIDVCFNVERKDQVPEVKSWVEGRPVDYKEIGSIVAIILSSPIIEQPQEISVIKK